MLARSYVRLAALATALACALGLALAMAQAPAGDVRVDARLTHTEATVGDRVGFELVVSAPPGWQVSVPDLPLRVGNLDLIERLGESTSADGVERHYRWVLSPFVTGDLFVPPVEIVARSPQGDEVIAVSPALAIRVNSVIPPGDQLAAVKDLRPQAELAEKGVTIPWPIVGAAAGGLVGLLVLVWLLRRLVRAIAGRARAVSVPVYLTSEDAARAALDELAAIKLSRRTLKRYYATLSQITRRYLADRYAFPAHALTTSEMAGRMGAEGIDVWQARLVAGLLAECDAVHFAQYVPAQQRAEHDLSLAYEIVELGRPRTIAEDAAAAPVPEPEGEPPRPDGAEPAGTAAGAGEE